MTNRKIEEGNEAVRGIWREIEERFEEWARRAMRCYWEWMEYMRGVWERWVFWNFKFFLNFFFCWWMRVEENC